MSRCPAPVVGALALLALVASAAACTNYLVTKGASEDASTQIAYAADDGDLYGSLGHYPAADHAPGATREVWDWDSGMYLGDIEEAAHTYNVVGNMNEHQLTIGETTFGGLPSLAGQTARMDYGNLIWVTLQRAKTAREAIAIMGNLTATYGYASEGESFSIADPNEVWVLELIGKGPGEVGAVWVAVKIPDGYVSGHANQARIRTFPQDDPETCIYADDVVSFAVKKGLYPASSSAADFSFSDVYDPVGFGGARFCEVRVWDFFQRVTSGMEQYLDYVQGRNLTNRMPLYVKVEKKLSVNDTMWYHRTHFEGTWFDNRGLPGAEPRVDAGAFNSPYRWRPLEWKYGNESYVNERTVGVHQTAWSFVAQMRSHLPNPIGGVFWFGVDDTAHSVHTPVYCASTKVPDAFADRYGQVPEAAVATAAEGDALHFSFDSAWWVFNLVANFAYSRYSVVSAEVSANIVAQERKFFEETAEVEQKAAELFKNNPAAAVEMLTAYSVRTGDQLVKDWLGLFTMLFTKYRDGFINTPSKPVCAKGQKKGCTGRPIPTSAETGYPAPWYGRIAKECGEHCEVPPSAQDPPAAADKSRLI